jgi:iron-sulfur cluster assembly protein
VPPMLTLTEKAADKTKELFEEKGLDSQAALRLFVVGGGCSGYQYGMALARQPDDDDLVIEHDGIKLVVDPDSAIFLEGAEIDYVDDLMNAGFTISRPAPAASSAPLPPPRPHPQLPSCPPSAKLTLL